MPWLVLCVIIVLAATLRFYRLSDLTSFHGDQARDVARVQKMIETRYPAVLGSGASVGTYLRGPAYYYLLLVPVWFSAGNPVAAAALVAVIDLGTVVLLFIVGKLLFSPWAGLVAAALWSCTPLVVLFARFSWNPNPLPFFVLLLILAIRQIVAGDDRYVLLAVPAWCIAWQLHEQTLLMLPFVFACAAWFRPRIARKHYVSALTLGVAVFAPFLLYEMLRGFPNTRGMLSVILHSRGIAGDGGGLGQIAARLGTIFEMLGRGLIPGTGVVHLLFRTAVALGVGWLLLSLRIGTYRTRDAQLFLLWLTVPFMYVFWPGRLLYHYTTIVFPLAFLLIGVCVDMLRRIWLPLGMLGGAAVAVFVATSTGHLLSVTQAAPLRPGTLGATKAAVHYVLDASQGKSFSFRLVSSFQGYEAFEVPYTYLFHWYKREPTTRDDVQAFTVYDPADTGNGAEQQGVVVNGIRIVRQPPPRTGTIR